MIIEADFECDCIDSDPRYIIAQEENNEIFIYHNYLKHLYNDCLYYDLQNNLRKLQQSGVLVYKGQGSTVDLWMRIMNRLR